ncbi:MAG: response regulator, partial [Phycisphaerae bacterium]
WVDSEVGHGSEFHVSLPLRGPESAPEPDDGAPSPGRHILVCDADPELAAAIAQTLRGDGCEVRVAHSGCRLLAQLNEWETHVVVTDVLLPDMDATELLDALRNMPRRSFRLVVHSYVDDGPELRRRGVDVFVRRPATRDEIREAVRVALQKKSADTRTVVLVEAGAADWRRFSRLLSADGHVPVVARCLSEATGIIRGCAADVVLVPADVLTEDWSNLRSLCDPGQGGARVIVIGEKLSKAQRRLAERLGVTLLPYRPGNEEVVVEALRNCREVFEPEAIR